MKSPIVLLFLVLVSCFLAAEAKKIQSWKFMNFNKYKNLNLGKGSVIDSSWGIQDHSGWLWFWKGADTLKNADIVDPSKETTDLVLRVKYPANSRNPEASPIGGLGFLAQPLNITKTEKVVSFQYSVYFPKGFDFVRGGKLPGLYGGHGECTGGSSSTACFTTRLMWRKGGYGEVYAYMPHDLQRKDLCDDKVNICNPDYGYSLGRDTFQFKTGQWTTVRQVLTLNTAGKKDGNLVIYVNGKQAFQEKNLVFRSKAAGRVVGIMFHTFFGGNDSSWKTPRSQFSYFKNFHLSTSTS